MEYEKVNISKPLMERLKALQHKKQPIAGVIEELLDKAASPDLEFTDGVPRKAITDRDEIFNTGHGWMSVNDIEGKPKGYKPPITITCEHCGKEAPELFDGLCAWCIKSKTPQRDIENKPICSRCKKPAAMVGELKDGICGNCADDLMDKAKQIEAEKASESVPDEILNKIRGDNNATEKTN